MAEALIIIGAPRSGTNMLRDLICRLPGCGTWPCDEINFIWRHGNVNYPSDAIPAERATPAVRRFVLGRFDAIARSRGLQTVVEKTCANSLRVQFVDRIVQDAKYVFVTRNGLDAVASAAQRWRARLDIRYTLKKARFVPLTDAPKYAINFLRNRWSRMSSSKGHVGRWGPILDGMDAMLATHSLEEVCAFQWRECVVRAAWALDQLGDDRVLRVRYEDIVADPAGLLRRVAKLLGRPDLTIERSAYEWVAVDRVGLGRQVLSGDVLARVEYIVGSVDMTAAAHACAQTSTMFEARHAPG